MKKLKILFTIGITHLVAASANFIGTGVTPAWDTNANWSSGVIPNGADAGANFSPFGSFSPSFNVSSFQPISIGTISFSAPNDIEIGLSGMVLEFLTTTSNGKIDITGQSTYTISAPILLTSSLDITQTNTPGTYTLLEIIGPIFNGTNSALSVSGGDSSVTKITGFTNYTGGTTISGGARIEFNDDSNLGATASPITLNNGGLSCLGGAFNTSRQITLTGASTVTVQMAGASTLSGKITGSGSLTLAPTGTLTLSNTSNDFTGGITIASGTVNVGSDSVLGNSNGTLNISNGTLQITAAPFSSARSGILSSSATISASNSASFSGNFSGAGSLGLTGGNTIYMTGTNTYSGGTTLSGVGTVLKGPSTAIPKNVTIGANTTLNFDQTTTTTFNGALTGPALATLLKTGSGSVTMTEDSPAFLGTALISEGTLSINSNFTNTPFIVNPNGNLLGSGTVGITSILSLGTINPGNGSNTSTLTVDTLTLASSAVTNINIDPLSASKLAITNSVSIDGNFIIEPNLGFYGFNASYTVLTSSLRSGFYSSVSTRDNNFIPSLEYLVDHSILLNIDIINPFALFTFSNANTKSVGNNIVALHTNNELPQDILNALNTLIGQNFSLVNNALDQMHPAIFSSITETLAENNAQLITLFERWPLKSNCCSPDMRIWITPFADGLTLKKKGMQIGSESLSYGFAIGFDGIIANNTVFGIGGVYNHTHLSWHNKRGSSHADSFYGSLYANSQMGSFCLSSAFLIGKNFLETNRRITFETTLEHARSNFNELDIVARISSLYLFGENAIFFFPYTNFDLLYLQSPKVKEHNANGFNLTINNRSDMTLRTEIGLGLQVEDVNYNDSICFTPKISLGFVNMCPLKRDPYTSTFQGGSIPFNVRGWNETWNLLNIDVGFFLSFNCFSIGGDYNVEISPNSKTTLFHQYGNLQFNWKW